MHKTHDCIRKKPREMNHAAKFRILGEDRSIKGAPPLLHCSNSDAREKSQSIAFNHIKPKLIRA